MIERISRHGDRANTTNSIDVKSGFHAAPYGLVCQCGRGSINMPRLRCWARLGMSASLWFVFPGLKSTERFGGIWRVLSWVLGARRESAELKGSFFGLGWGVQTGRRRRSWNCFSIEQVLFLGPEVPETGRPEVCPSGRGMRLRVRYAPCSFRLRRS